MELVHGISTHFIQSKKFKTNKLRDSLVDNHVATTPISQDFS